VDVVGGHGEKVGVGARRFFVDAGGAQHETKRFDNCDAVTIDGEAPRGVGDRPCGDDGRACIGAGARHCQCRAWFSHDHDRVRLVESALQFVSGHRRHTGRGCVDAGVDNHVRTLGPRCAGEVDDDTREERVDAAGIALDADDTGGGDVDEDGAFGG
jgi:hypothetical protein